MYIKSKDIKIFPGTRDYIYDPNSNNLTEQNINSIVNRFTNNSSWIIKGIEFDGLNVSAGEFCIDGYYFKLENQLSINTSNNDKYLYLCMNISSDVKNSIYNSRLKGIDKINYDYSDLSVISSFYNGVYFESNSSPKSNSNNKKYLKVAEKIGSSWINSIESRVIYNNNFAVDDLSL